MSSVPNSSGRRTLWLLLAPPALAMIGGFITLFIAASHPDQEIKVEKVSTIQTETGTHQHVTNSVTPPLK